MKSDREWMDEALALSRRAGAEGEVPVGAVVVSAGGELVGAGWNRPIKACDPTAHAEVLALREAARRQGNYRLPGCTLYVTIEPCAMCAGAMVHSRIARLVFGATEPKAGAVISQLRLLDAESLNHRVRYEGGLAADVAGRLLSDFFAARRGAKKTSERD